VDLIDLWLVYAQGHDMVVYLVRNFGEDAVKRILDYYRRCPDFDLALKHVTGMDRMRSSESWITTGGARTSTWRSST